MVPRVRESHAVDVALGASHSQPPNVFNLPMNGNSLRAGCLQHFCSANIGGGGSPRPAKKIDVGDFSLLSRCGETAALDRYFKGPGDSVRRLLSFFQHLFPTRRASTT